MRKIKLLYLSCHSIAEYDEVSLFREIGIDVKSHGTYANPNNPGDKKRPPIKGEYDDQFVSLVMRYGKDKLPREIIEPFDVVLSHWMPQWIENNWEVMKDKIVILRTNGQSTRDNEKWMKPYREQGLKIVRYSPIEKTIPDYIGHDAVIRFYKDPDEWKDWNGRRKRVITVGQSMKKRGVHCGFHIFKAVTSGFERKLFGPENEDTGHLWGGLLSFEKLKQQLRDNRVYFYTGTMPASYTLNFIEAWMTGIPIVAIGGELGNAPFLEKQYTYEIPFIMKNGVEGFWSDDFGALAGYIEQLMCDDKLAERVSKAGREKAIELFGKAKIKKQWQQFFKNL
jgi:glycosyltransferase involved in cell wall biosynthesis